MLYYLPSSIATSNTSQGGADIERVMYLRDPRYRSQFIAQWDEAGLTSTFMTMVKYLTTVLLATVILISVYGGNVEYSYVTATHTHTYHVM